MDFVGRQAYFEWLDTELARVSPAQGRFLALRGRRQVGKSRLLTEWLRKRGHPHLYYQALDKPVVQELESFRNAVARSGLGALSTLTAGGAVWPDWSSALGALPVAAQDAGRPIVVVIDELPYIIRNDRSFEATLQSAWDHEMQHSGILLIVVGSDLAMMEALSTYGRPLYQRIDTQRRVDPLNIAEVADLLALDAVEAFDTYLVTGGFPRIVAARAEHRSQRAFLRAATADEAHPLVYTGEQMLAAEVPPIHQPRAVLEAIGHGERSFGAIRTRAGTSEKGLVDALDLLKEKRMIAAEDPWCAKRVRGRTRYRVANPYVRFWLRFLSGRGDDIARGRGDLVMDDLLEDWATFAGGAIEPLVRDSLERLLPDARFGRARHVGSFWTRDNQVQVDLTGTDGTDGARLELAGSIKWRTSRKFGPGDVSELEALTRHVPGADSGTIRVGVSRTGFTGTVDLDVQLTPNALLDAWR